MKRMPSMTCLFLLLCACPLAAQVSTGTPRFGSFGGGPFDTTNLGNLNVHYSIPILHKTGRGMPFAYDLSYDSSIYQIVTSSGTKSWQPITNNGSIASYWGWQGLGPTFSPHIGYNIVYTVAACGPNGQYTYQEWQYSNFVYYDTVGTSHPFPASGTYYASNSCNGYGPPNGPQPPGVETTTAGDSSGYSLNASFSQGTAGGYIKTVSGATLNVPWFAGQPFSSPYTGTDANGNEITFNSNNGTYTDTLGTTVLTVAGTKPNPVTFSYTPPVGTQKYTVNFSPYNVKTNFGCQSVKVTEYSESNVSLVSSIVLADGSQYSFSYEDTPNNSGYKTGRISQVTLPTGGSISYNYTYAGSNDGINCTDGSTMVLQRTVSPGGQWQYARTLVSGTPGTGSSWTTTVTDPNNNQTVINFAEDGNTSLPTYSLYETQRQVYQGTSTLLAKTIRCYNAVYANCTTVTVRSPITQTDVYSQLPSLSTRLSEVIYNLVGLVTDDKEFDYGVKTGTAPGTTNLIRQTHTTYATLGNNILNRPASVTISDWSSGSAVTLASTTYAYDQGTPTGTSGTPQHVSVTGSRGNMTTVTSSTSSTTSLSKTFTYYDTGNLNVATDVNSAQTTYVYSSASNPYNGAYTASCGNSFATTINEPLTLSRSMQWNCIGGVAQQVTDENLNIVKSDYTDSEFWRPADVYDQENNETKITYIGQTVVESALQNFNGGNSSSDFRKTVDGFGRAIFSQRLQGPGATYYDTSEIDYNNMGQPYRSTMPYSAAASPSSDNMTAPASTTTYDALGRVLSTVDANGGYISYQYTNNDVLQTVSGTPTGTQSFQKQFEYDGLGRLTSVCEISLTLPGVGTCLQGTHQSGYWTKYTYDALGHPLTSTQNAQASSGSQQNRTFQYDWLGRLTSETNPESGTVHYFYDTASGTDCSGTSNGDLIKKVDAAQNWTCYQYDPIHRLTDIGNSIQDTNSPCRRFRYDTKANATNTTPPSGYPASPNIAGRLMQVETDAPCTAQRVVLTDEWFSYDKDGRLTDVWESTPHSGGYYHSTAAYWPTGLVQTLSLLNSSGSALIPGQTYGLDAEGRPNAVSAASGQNPVTSVSYSTSSTTNPLGSLTGLTFGSGDSDAFTYDPNTGRIGTYTFSVNGHTDKGTLTWSANGTLTKFMVSDQIPNTVDSQTCTYGYDDAQRISNVTCGSLWVQNFTYDPFGNITKNVPAGDGGTAFLPTYWTSPPNNQFESLPGVTPRYDSLGNLLVDNLNSYTWGLYGQMATVTPSGGSTVTSTYDAMGRMVENNAGGTYNQFVYGSSGKKLAKCNGQTLVRAFVSLPGGAKAIYTATGLTYYRHSDWLGSSRLTSTSAAPTSMYSSSAYAPFGEQYATAGSADASFTGKDQDTVGNLYDFPARRLNPSQGRWISPDPAGLAAVKLGRPQSWNRYVYAENNPLVYIDEDGTTDCNDEADSCGGGDDNSGGDDNGGDDNSGNGDCQYDACVTAPDPGQNPCVVFIGGTGDGAYDSAFTTAAAATGTAVYVTSYPGSIPTELAAQAYNGMPGVSSTPCGGTCQDVSAQINALEQANPQGLLLIPFSGGAGPVNQGAGSGALNSTGINGIIYFSPGSPAGYAPEFNGTPTFTYWGSGPTNSLVYAANGTEFNGGGTTPTYSGLPPGSSATIPNCDHDFGCEYGGSGLGNTLQSDCNPSTSENRSNYDQNEERFAVRPKDSDGDKGIAEVDTWPARDQRGQL